MIPTDDTMTSLCALRPIMAQADGKDSLSFTSGRIRTLVPHVAILSLQLKGHLRWKLLWFVQEHIYQ